MESWASILVSGVVTIVVAIIASGGFWGYIQKRDVSKSAQTRLLLGIAHDRIIYLGMQYVDRGFVTKDEYEDLHKYLYEPYQEFGGNGLAERVMEEVSRLPIRGRFKTHVEVKNGTAESNTVVE